MRTVVFTIPGKPVPKGRPRFKNGRVYTPKKTREYEELVASYTLGKGTIEGPVRASLWVAPDEVRIMLEQIEAVKHGLRGDLDNYLKSCLDGLQLGGVFGNDRQVQHLQGAFSA